MSSRAARRRVAPRALAGDLGETLRRCVVKNGCPSVPPPIGIDDALGVRHQAEHVAALVADAGDVVERAVGRADPPGAREPSASQ